jgi:hypothetical protein
MKRYTMSAAASTTHTPTHPERTAFASLGRGPMDFDVTYQVWPNRVAMLKSIDLQRAGEPTPHMWTACRVPAPAVPYVEVDRETVVDHTTRLSFSVRVF